MSLNERIIGALLPLGIPVAPGVYTGEEKTYLTFNYATVGADYGDDEPQHELALVQVHLFCPVTANNVATRRRIKRLLRDAGFTWPSVEDAGVEGREKASRSTHLVFECRWAGGLEDV